MFQFMCFTLKFDNSSSDIFISLYIYNLYKGEWAIPVHLNSFIHANTCICVYNQPINFCRLSLDKTDHVVQNRTMVVRGYPPSYLISSDIPVAD